MADISDYLESGLLHHIFRGQSFAKPTGMAIALTSGVPVDSHTGETIPEIPSGINGSGTGYSRIEIGPPSSSGDGFWTYSSDVDAAGSGYVSNTSVVDFGTALVEWGPVSGIAIVDAPEYGSGNLLMQSQLDNPRHVYKGDSLRFDAGTLKVFMK